MDKFNPPVIPKGILRRLNDKSIGSLSSMMGLDFGSIEQRVLSVPILKTKVPVTEEEQLQEFIKGCIDDGRTIKRDQSAEKVEYFQKMQQYLGIFPIDDKIKSVVNKISGQVFDRFCMDDFHISTWAKRDFKDMKHKAVSIPDWKHPIPTKAQRDAVSSAPHLNQKEREKLNAKRALNRKNRKDSKCRKKT